MQHPIVNGMLPNVAEFLCNHPLGATDYASINEWKNSCEQSWSALTTGTLSYEESSYSLSIFKTFLNAYSDLASLVAEKKHGTTNHWSLKERTNAVERLLQLPQIEQRTEAWYLDAVGLLSASQFNCILKPGRTRGMIVLQKASTQPPDIAQRRNCVLTNELNPFTWGIRFEPIVKQIYQKITNTKVAELGRLRHKIDSRLAASPDGLITEGPDTRIGRFVEFKAPITRKIISVIPEDYLAQMQIQMEVGDVEECDYFEVKFNSFYPKKEMLEKPSLDEKKTFYGRLFIVGNIENPENIRYEYSPLDDDSWLPTILDGEEILEVVPWWTNNWFMTTVGRSRSWFESVQPAIKAFWEDVEKAKLGEFELPQSNRKTKEPVCQIVDDNSVGSIKNEKSQNSCLILEDDLAA
jgi:hypothetical protein